MDYDKTAMPEVYDAGRGYAPEVLEMWLRTVEAAVDGHRVRDILDLGCGTGRYSAALANHFGARVIAVDPSEKMLEVARQKPAPAVEFIKAPAEALPLDDAAIDLIFISMAVHHFEDLHQAVRECRRVLRDGGTLCLRNGSSDRADIYPFTPFFPRSATLIRERLPSVAEMMVTFSEAGFRCLRHDIVTSRVGRDWADFAERTAFRADSILQQLSDEEFRSGLEALRAYADAQIVSEPVVEPIDFLVFRPKNRPAR
jgi:ubiquinone/menaquinone biosynthesis C-methylase UbiE